MTEQIKGQLAKTGRVLTVVYSDNTKTKYNLNVWQLEFDTKLTQLILTRQATPKRGYTSIYTRVIPFSALKYYQVIDTFFEGDQ